MRKILFLSILVLLFSDCSTVPITGRKRVNFVSDAQVLPMSFQQYSGFLQKNSEKIVTNTSEASQIKSIGNRIAASVDKYMRANGMTSEANSYKWEFNLIDDPTVNAWCMPGGKVVFYTGILPICANTDGIAAVMGHEVAHAFAKHGQERMSSSQIQQLGGVALALGTRNSKNSQLWNMLYGVGSKLGTLAYSRTHETEADRLGLVFMIMAGYDGKEAINVWKRMKQSAKKSGREAPPQFLSTHPSNEARIVDLQNYLPIAKRLALRYNR